MKTIGLIGGMSWESTVTYYQIINETVRRGWADCTRQKYSYTALSVLRLRNVRQKENGREAGRS